MADLKKRLSETPHLRIPFTVDIQKLAAEVNDNIFSWSSIQIDESLAGDSTSKEFADAWRARGLIDYSPDSNQIITYQYLLSHNEKNLKVFPYYKTELYDRMHGIRNLIEQISKKPRVCRLFLLKANKSLPWHRHNLQSVDSTDYNTLIFQIPILNSENSVYEVKHRVTEEIFPQVYRPGEVWVFNSFHFHRVVNNDSVDRVSLFIETDIADVNLDLKKIIQNTVA